MARAEVGQRRISPYIRLIHFWVPHSAGERSDPIRELHFLMFFCFFAFSNLRRERGFRSSLGGPNYATCRCVEKKSMFAFLSVWKTRRRYANSGRLLADHILQQIGSERSDSIREMHFWTFSVFLCFQTWRRVRGFENIFRHQPSPAEARQAGSSQAGPSRAAPTGRPYTH